MKTRAKLRRVKRRMPIVEKPKREYRKTPIKVSAAHIKAEALRTFLFSRFNLTLKYKGSKT
jgi:hypothetical protein